MSKEKPLHIYEPNAYRQDVGSYWETTETPPVWRKLSGDLTAMTVIIGGGYTGLNCALELVEGGADPAGIVILEGEQPGWGASGRNGGFCCMGGTKMPIEKQLKIFGEAETKRFLAEQIMAIATVRSNLARYGINADTHSHGETVLAHRPGSDQMLATESRHLRDLANVDAVFISKEQLAKEGMASPEFHGALVNPNGFALNPMKYVSGLARQAESMGISVFGHSPALAIEKSGGGYAVTTQGGKVLARNLVIATNGYSSENLPPWLAGRLLPVLTNIIVTRPLAEDEVSAQGWTSTQMCYDARASLHYFRLMPPAKGETGPRMLFGMRGGTSASEPTMVAMHKRLRQHFERVFPAWRQVETPFFWSGLACLTRNLTSYCGPIPDMENAYASLAYHGNGVAMGSHSGRLVGRMISGDLDAADLPPAMRVTPQRFPFPALRRTYLAGAYKWHEWRDG
jgi:glycine/D-amino acid oxidase-like deaminating enzyme